MEANGSFLIPYRCFLLAKGLCHLPFQFNWKKASIENFGCATSLNFTPKRTNFFAIKSSDKEHAKFWYFNSRVWSPGPKPLDKFTEFFDKLILIWPLLRFSFSPCNLPNQQRWFVRERFEMLWIPEEEFFGLASFYQFFLANLTSKILFLFDFFVLEKTFREILLFFP